MPWKWRIRKVSNGRFIAERGIPNTNGYIMSKFIVYESATFNTKKEAKAYINRGGSFRIKDGTL